MSNFPKLPNKLNEEQAVEYVGLIYQGVERVKAYEQVFPDRYNRIKNKAIKDRRDVRQTVISAINVYEGGKYVNSLLQLGAEKVYTRFISKKMILLDKMYDVAMDENNDMKHRLVATKTFLTHIPELQQTQKVEVEVNVKDAFKEKLAERQKMLYSLANNEEILDAEVDYE